jgi:uncharacterized protein (TIGR03083 family)
MNITTTSVNDIRPIERTEAHALAVEENKRMLALLASLSAEDWTKPTDCVGWDVRALAGHVLGGAEGFSSVGNLVHLMRAAKKEAGKGSFVDGMTAVQVRERADLLTPQLLERMAKAGPLSARFRSRMPAPFRAMSMKQELLSGATEKWKMAYLLDVILTRDTWMHRVDLTRATGREMVLNPEHDGRIVADAVAEWARRHGQPFTLVLTGPAGGTFVSGSGGETFSLDAVDMCRNMSGRSAASGLLAHEVPF